MVSNQRLALPRSQNGGKRTFWPAVLLLIIALVLVIAWSVLNPKNPFFDPAAKGELDAQAVTMAQEGSIVHAERWKNFLRSPGAECHYKSSAPQEYMFSGTVPDAYIVPNSGNIRWFVRTPTNLQPSLFEIIQIQAGVTSMQKFYWMVQSEGFVACTETQSAKAHNMLIPWLQ